MRRRWPWLVAGAVGLAALGVGALSLAVPRSAINRANFEKIQAGMTLDEVEGSLGPPSPGTYVPGPWYAASRAWFRDGVSITVFFDEQRVVLHQVFEGGEPFLDRLRGWLPW